jgi:hypothetical protein
MKTIGDAFKLACQIHTDFAVRRYLICNTVGRLDGFEKASVHRELCTFYTALHLGVSVEDVDTTCQEYDKIHEATQALTDYMDERIGFPLYSRPDYDSLAPVFFHHFHELAVSAVDSYISR